MPLSAGARIGSFEVLSPIGAGGMGEVYRARDTKLGRDVALKILPDAFALDPDRLARFRREAHVLASLNHSNIAHIYGLEDDGRVTALVMELVEGPTLADRIAQGPVPLDEALAIARQIAQALDAAHERGIIHRDLKPANVKLDEDGTVKVLDFGLAKALDPAATGDVSNSPTITSPAMTERGVILGTAGYMAPEQAKGRGADKRADIFAFGVVLYEMLAGRRLFDGETVSELLASVIKEEPSLDAVPASVRPLLKRCLEKDPKKRLRDIGDVWLLLDVGGQSSTRTGRRWLPWAVSAACGALAVVSLAAALWRAPVTAPAVLPVLQFSADAPAGMVFAPPDLAGISPDGQWLLFGVQESSASSTSLWLRSVRSVTARRLEGTEGAGPPFWSPDSRSIAFTSAGKLKRLNLAGGSPAVLCDWTGARSPGTWSRDGLIVVAGTDGLFSVPAGGGAPVRLTTVDVAREKRHAFPQFVPGNRLLYFVDSDDVSVRGVHVRPFGQSGTGQRILAADTKAIYVSGRDSLPDVLLFVRGTTLVAQRFDLANLHATGEPVLVADGLVVYKGFFAGQAPFWSSDAGSLMYRTGTLSYAVNWIDRNGRRSPSGIPVGNYFDLRLSPDGTRVAIARVQNGASDVWQWEFERSTWTRLTLDERNNNYPVWSGDGRQVAFSSAISAGHSVLYRTDADGGGQLEKLADLRSGVVSDWSRDSRYITFSQSSPPPAVGADVWALPVQATPREPVPLIRGPFSDSASKFAPVGKWMAFGSRESGREEVYLQAFTEPRPDVPVASGRRWPVSRMGGSNPLWRDDGREIYFIAPDNKLMAAEIRLGPDGVDVGNPRELFTARFMTLNAQPYDVAPKGQRFLVLEARDPGLHPPFTVAVNWQDALPK